MAWHESDAWLLMKKLQVMMGELKSQEEARKRAYEARDAASNINSRRHAQIAPLAQRAYDDEFNARSPSSRKAIALAETQAEVAATSLGGPASRFEYTAILDIIEETSLLANTEDSSVSSQTQTAFEYDERGRRTKEFINGTLAKEFFYDQFDNLIQVNIGEKTYKYVYDYRGRRLVFDEIGAGGKYKRIHYSGGTSVSETEHDRPDGPAVKTILYYRGPDIGGGVGGILHNIGVRGFSPVRHVHLFTLFDIII